MEYKIAENEKKSMNDLHCAQKKKSQTFNDEHNFYEPYRSKVSEK